MKRNELKFFGTANCRFQIGWLFICLFTALSMSACSDDDETPIEPFRFPEAQTLYVSAGETTSLSFSVNGAWILTSSQTWCTFNGELTTSGDAGSHTITLTITDVDQSLDADTEAAITMTAEGQSVVIATIIRSASGAEIIILNAAGEEVTEMKAGYSEYLYYTLTANYEFSVAVQSDWLEIDGTLYSTANTPVTVGLKVTDEANYYKYEQVGEVVLTNPEGSITKAIAISYPGMDADAIVISAPTRSAWHWEVSADGLTFSQEGTEYEPFFTLNALNDDYVVVCMEVSTDGYLFGVDSRYGSEPTYEDVTWLHIEDDGAGEILVTADAAESQSREAYLFAFPRAVYETIQGDLLSAIIDDDEVLYEYLQNNTLMQLTQNAEVAGDKALFVVTDGMYTQEFELEYTYSGPISGFQDLLEQKYGTTDIAFLKYTVGTTYIFSALPLNVSNEWMYEPTEFCWADGADAWNDSETYLSIEGTNYYKGSLNYPATQITFNYDPYDTIYMVFTDDAGGKRIMVFYNM